jgi:hypothetical protein
MNKPRRVIILILLLLLLLLFSFFISKIIIIKFWSGSWIHIWRVYHAVLRVKYTLPQYGRDCIRCPGPLYFISALPRSRQMIAGGILEHASVTVGPDNVSLRSEKRRLYHGEQNARRN